MDDALLLARAQFGLNIGFHIMFPALTIALAWYLVGFRLVYQRTRDAAWLATYRLWVKVFALSFAMGVVTGVVMSFQFGTSTNPGLFGPFLPGSAGATFAAHQVPVRARPVLFRHPE